MGALPHPADPRKGRPSMRLKVLAILTVAVTAVAVMALNASPASAATATFTTVRSWDNGYQGEISITNDSSSQITSWRVEFDLPAGTAVSQVWNAQQSTSGSRYSFTNVGWNGTLAP